MKKKFCSECRTQGTRGNHLSPILPQSPSNVSPFIFISSKSIDLFKVLKDVCLIDEYLSTEPFLLVWIRVIVIRTKTGKYGIWGSNSFGAESNVI